MQLSHSKKMLNTRVSCLLILSNYNARQKHAIHYLRKLRVVLLVSLFPQQSIAQTYNTGSCTQIQHKFSSKLFIPNKKHGASTRYVPEYKKLVVTCSITVGLICAGRTGAKGGHDNEVLLDIELGCSSQGFAPHIDSNNQLQLSFVPGFGAGNKVDNVVICADGRVRHGKFLQR
jgi:hypothetical protein